jgi:hypothetical protein
VTYEMLWGSENSIQNFIEKTEIKDALGERGVVGMTILKCTLKK